MPKINLPVTRYYGSKRKLVDLIWSELENINVEFNSVLDVFGGSGIFSYYSKLRGKSVIYNDIFLFNQIIGEALIQNNSNELSEEDVHNLLIREPNRIYQNYIAENFHDIYFTDEENYQIDTVIQNIGFLPIERRASAYYLLFQSCLIKRPYNLFHRKNLNLRTNFNGGGFGNKVTWERPFKELFLKFNSELNKYVFDNGQNNISLNHSALQCNLQADLVYIDPPYFRSVNHVPYHSKYHFLEGLANYNLIPENIDHTKLHREINLNKSNEFENKNTFLNDLEELIEMHQNSIIAISYRSNGVPTIAEIESLLNQYKNNVRAINLKKYSYALNSKGSENYEFLILGF
ncbi:DNA adenine methylase [Flavobacterium dankookense]|uniref:site-specific DNA-methyltransferase (adenine-specific) n=1 Tax=Flavobacterium dankookense TaxID=706186 RepID=A0A4R6QC03_9FLAO|nr:DNA adenine methylase [Flavobacterium dankookense]TDP58859.1 adenine-specific DNA-methyltransferase [Flavobacterium dankookense]